jgi:hypothetical protein
MPTGKNLTIGDHDELIREIASDPDVQLALGVNGDKKAYQKRMTEYVETGVCHGLSVYWLQLMTANGGDASKSSEQMRTDLQTPSLLKFLVSFVVRFIKQKRSQEKSSYYQVFSYQNNLERLGKAKQSPLAVKALGAQNTFSFLGDFATDDELAEDKLAALISKLPANEPCIINGIDHATAYYKNAQGECYWYDANNGEVLKTDALTIAKNMLRYGARIELVVHRKSTLDPFADVAHDCRYGFRDADGRVSAERVRVIAHSDDTTVQKSFVAYFLETAASQTEPSLDINLLLLMINRSPPCCLILLEWIGSNAGRLEESMYTELKVVAHAGINAQVTNGNREFLVDNAKKIAEVIDIPLVILALSSSLSKYDDRISHLEISRHLIQSLVAERVDLGEFVAHIVEFRQALVKTGDSLGTLGTDSGAKAFIVSFCGDNQIDSLSQPPLCEVLQGPPLLVVEESPVESDKFKAPDSNTDSAPKAPSESSGDPNAPRSGQ